MCRECGASYKQYNTTQRLCNKCFYNKYAKPKKPLKRRGKIADRWVEVRNDWIQKNSDGTGVWNCYLCGKILTINNLTLDHVIPRSARPDLRFEHSNLKPCCYSCNIKKGSKH